MPAFATAQCTTFLITNIRWASALINALIRLLFFVTEIDSDHNALKLRVIDIRKPQFSGGIFIVHIFHKWSFHDFHPGEYSTTSLLECLVDDKELCYVMASAMHANEIFYINLL